jgi:hypothetical protein
MTDHEALGIAVELGWERIAGREIADRRRTAHGPCSAAVQVARSTVTSFSGTAQEEQTMDVQTIDQEYGQLQQEAQLVGQTIEAFAAKMQAAGDGGDANAKAWLLDLKGIALQIQQEELQVQALLQALHDFTASNLPPNTGGAGYAAPAAAPTAADLQQQPQPAAPTQNARHGFLSGSFGQAIATGAGMGAGFGMTESLINSIFS